MTEIIRPTFVVDKKICLHNIEKMANKARENNLRFRPHFKTHQSAQIGRWFRDFDVKAITVSSVLMAEYFATNGWSDITIAFPVNIPEIENINQLAAKIKLNVLVENREAATTLVQKIKFKLGVYLKIDTGYNRTGILFSATNNIDTLVEMLSENKNLMLRGFLSHTGHTYQAHSVNEIQNRHFDALMKMNSLKQKYRTDFPALEISLGDTPSCSICSNFEGLDEIRPGNFVFYDAMMLNLGVCNFNEIAGRMVCPVVAKHMLRNEIVIYGGAVHLSKESIIAENGNLIFGRIVIRKNDEKILLNDENYVASLSQEHGILKVEQSQFKNFHVGDLVEIIPVHSCLTANLAKKYLTTEGEEILTVNS
jgi:D-serine deaminase-like pyridoxal phosphate-dependent protein